MSRSVGSTRMIAGASVAALGAAGLAVGAWVNLQPAAVVALAQALPFVAGGGLLAAGAVVRRTALRRSRAVEPRRAAELPPG